MTRNAGPGRFLLRLALAAALCLAAAPPLLLVEAQEGSAPAKPKGLSATASHDSVTLTWDDPQDDSITGYVILRRNRKSDAQGVFDDLAPDTGSAATTYTDDRVKANTSYTYRIKAINEYGVSERSRWFRIDTLAVPVPDKPKGLSATASHDSVTLTWDDPQDDSITGYVILRRNRKSDAQGVFDDLAPDTGSAATTYTDDRVKANISYTYRIKAINEYGVSERSRWFHIDTLAAPQETVVEGDDQDEQGGDDDGGGAPDHTTPGGAGARANVTVEFGAASYTAAEGGSAVTVTVNLSADPERSVTIPISASGADGADTGDYSLSAKSVTIDGGETSATFTVTATDDTVDDDDESVALSFGTPLPDEVSEGSQSTATVNLTDDDHPQVRVEFGAASYTAAEGGSAVTVTVNLSADPERSVTIPISASGADGADTGDYSLSATSVTIDGGETSATFTVTATDDTVDDDDESVALSFGTPCPTR